MTKKERVIAAINKDIVDYVPSSFSLHFDKNCNRGEAGIKAHLDFFKESDTDIFKIMNENLVPAAGKEAVFPAAYSTVGPYSRESGFINTQLDFTKAIIDRCNGEGFFMGTLHGICASALHPIETSGIPYEEARLIQLNSLRSDKKTTLEAFKRVTEALCELVRGYKNTGVDAVFYASLGAEHRYFTDEEFDEYIKPFDIEILKAIREEGMYSFLHICKDGLNMNRYNGYAQYADVVNWGVYEAPYSLEEGKNLFEGCTILGGLKNRSGVLVDGSDEEIKNEVHSIINTFGKTGLILGADCTLATDQDMHKLRTAIQSTRNM